MSEKPTYEELEQRIRELESAESELKHVETALYESEEGTIELHNELQDHKQVEMVLRESKELFSKIFYDSPMSMVITKMSDGKCVEINSKFSSIFGYDRKEAIGRNSIELGFWPNQEDRKKVTRVLQKKKTVKDMEIEFRNRSGELQIGLISLELINFKGELCIVTVLNDITERKQTEEALKQSEERYHHTFEKNPAVKLIINPEDGSIIEANNAACKFYGYSKNKISSLKISDINVLSPDKVVEEMENAKFKKKEVF